MLLRSASNLARRRFVVIVPALALLVLVVMHVRYTVRAGLIAASPHIQAEELGAEYEKNGRLASHRYGGKLVVVTGRVIGTDEGLFGDGAIHMDSGLGTTVQCFVPRTARPVGYGQEITVFGKCDGIDAYGVIRVEGERIAAP